MASSPAVFVTGGNSGIGLALCAQLLVDHNARVFMGSRDVEKGKRALKELCLPYEAEGRCSIIQVDTSKDDSVKAAAAAVKSALGENMLYGVVNNAGTGLNHGTGANEVVETNFYGPKRVAEAFLPLIDVHGRVVNVGSGAGGMYVGGLGETNDARTMIKDDVTMDEIEVHVKKYIGTASMGAYGLSKAALAQYTKVFAKENPNIMCSCCTPGFIDTPMTKGYGASKTPAEGTLAIKKLLFEKLEGNGWYYGSDGVRSPYHVMRNPGQPAYDGIMPF